MSINETISREWDSLSHRAQEWALRTGRARRVEVTAECTDSQSVAEGWIDSASWPTYDLAIYIGGKEVGTVAGWHFCDPDDESVANNDGQCNGLPRVRAGGPGLQIAGGENVGIALDLPLVDEDGVALIYDEDQIDDALLSAAGDAEHDWPTIDDIGRERIERLPCDTLYAVRDYRIEEIEIYRATAFRTYEDFDGDKDRYYLTAYTADAGATMYESMRDLRDEHGALYDTQAEAQAALDEIVDDRLGDLDDLPEIEHGRDDDGRLYARPADAGEDNIYHLDEDETARVCQHGWIAILDELREAFGARQTLAALRSWAQDMDRLIAERDPFVCPADSLAAGNCRAETERMRARLAELLGGDVGAVRASVILGLRDDAYTRRACRMAAARIA